MKRLPFFFALVILAIASKVSEVSLSYWETPLHYNLNIILLILINLIFWWCVVLRHRDSGLEDYILYLYCIIPSTRIFVIGYTFIVSNVDFQNPHWYEFAYTLQDKAYIVIVIGGFFHLIYLIVPSKEPDNKQRIPK